MYFQSSDLFLINRDSVSSVMDALTIKNIVNPVGVVEQPSIRQPTVNQGFPIGSDAIIRNFGVDDVNNTVTLKLESLQDLELLGPIGVPLTTTEPIETTSTYTPITTSINTINDLTNDEYELFFSPINYDLKYFEANELIHLEGNATEYRIVNVDMVKGTMTISSNTDFTGNVGKKVESIKTLKGTGKLVKFYIHDQEKNDYRCDIEEVDGEWVSSPHNNRRQEIKFATEKPKGGSHVDLNNATFEADPFVCDNSVLHLTKVTWTLNGIPYEVPITDKEGIQYWQVPPDANWFDGAVNSVSVVYMAGQNSSRDKVNPNTVYFVPKSSPFKMNSSVRLLDNIETLTLSVTNLGL